MTAAKSQSSSRAVATNDASQTPTHAMTRQLSEEEQKDLALYSEDAGSGFEEGLSNNAYALPFLGILQGLSPQVARNTPGYIQNATPGLLFNTVTKELFESVDVAVLRRTETYCFWTPRGSGGGGGFKGEQPISPAMVDLFESGCKIDDKNRRITPDGLEMTEHKNFYCQLFRPGKTSQPIVISMTKSQLREAKVWNTMLATESVRVPGADGAMAPVGFSEIWTLTAILRVKGENQWYVWSVKHKERNRDPMLKQEVKAAVAVARTQRVLARALDPSATTDDEGGGGSEV